MRKILFVEDDAVISRVYSTKLTTAGFDVILAEDGLQAVQKLRDLRPDLIVLDLLMPKLTGVDVLKFIRSHAELKDTRIIVFSNSFLGNLIEQVSAIGVEEAFVKASVTPGKLVEIINHTLEKPPRTFLTAAAMSANLSGFGPDGVEKNPAPKISQASSPPQPPPTLVQPTAKPAPPSEFDALARNQFVQQMPAVIQSMRQICREFLEAENSEPRKLEDLRRKIGFVAQTLGVSGRHRYAQLAVALEAMLFELHEKPATITDSQRHTIANTIAFLSENLEHTEPDQSETAPQLKVFVVDDDIVANRAVVLALIHANLSATSFNDPFVALKNLRENSCSLVLLDINMPGMDGIQLCEQMRALPQHKKTPVIFVTSQDDFKTRARSLISGGNDLIAKPILPAELCVKALAHLLKK